MIPQGVFKLKNMLKKRIYLHERTNVNNEGYFWEEFLKCFLSLEWHESCHCLTEG